MSSDQTPSLIREPYDDPNLSDAEILAQRSAWFERYTHMDNVSGDPASGPYYCPCCKYLTLSSRGGYNICAVCFWEDDGQDDHDADVVRGGPNKGSLTTARASFRRIGACDEALVPHVRPPLPNEMPPTA